MINRIAPLVPVYDISFQYIVWDTPAAFTVEPIQVAPGEPPRQTSMLGRNETDTLQGYALTDPIPDILLGVNREKAQAILLAHARFLESKFVTSYEYQRAKLIESQVPAASGYGDWDNPQKNPLTDLDNAIRTINATAGKMPNTIVFGSNAWARLRANPLAREVVSYNSVGLFNEDLLNRSLFMRMNEVFVNNMPFYDPSGQGKTMMEDDVYILYKEDSPTQFDASAIKTFALNGQFQREVTTEYFPTNKETKVTNRVYSLTKLTNPGAIIRINTASAD
ncbi:hypothetical protein [Akkermansia muciniphila]|uniref:major capsid protein n=1 Tax=Akkermansia muciniphila TaxID=239935 RepID=UPI000C9C054C|nr:hypothetical protein [Akkermansia muciniphila]PNC79331.1 hypothetical protein CXT92_09440 [Akkermansia muciniphila]PNC89851.1 hypothetical protein CXT91_09885 [Akkermansia muciniphila]PND11893.1 hypothetical protein CXT96_12045 [Akkermansia muciniphila]